MNETTATPTDSGDSTTSTEGGEAGDTVETLQAKVAELTLERNKAAQIARKRQDIIDALEAGKSDDGEPVKPTEPKKLDQAKHEISRLQTQLAQKDEMLREKLLKEAVFEHGEKILSADPKAREQWWKLNKENFALTDDGKPELKDGFESLPSFIKQTVKESPWFSFTSKASGSGVPEKGKTVDSTGKITLESLGTLPRRERIAAMVKDPELRKQYQKLLSSK